MEEYKKQLLNILKCAIKDEKYISNEDNFEWEKIQQEAYNHDISALIYYSISKNTLKTVDKETLNKWRVDILKSNTIQIHMLNLAKEILLGLLKKKEISVIVLKGFILKEFYPRPEFRTMSDLDILIHKEDYSIVKEFLIQIGYTCKKTKHPVHITFYCNNSPVIEVHLCLVNKNYYIGDIEEFENSIWKNSKETSVDNLKLRTLGDEDFLIHICIHMAVHAKCSGFGLRQLYDLALFTKNNYESIDWLKFKDRINKFGILKFTKGLYILCDKLFEVKVPFFDIKDTSLKEEQVNLFLENIIYFGTYGSIGKDGNCNFLYKYVNLWDKLKKIIQVIFENRNELTPKYNYVKKHFYLLPVAWIHRILKNIKKYGILKIFKLIKQVIAAKEKKNEIEKIFNL